MIAGGVTSWIKANKLRTTLLVALGLLLVSPLSVYAIGFPIKIKDPNSIFFNPKNFRFSDYEYDPSYMEEVARRVLPQGMDEDDVDQILLIDVFSSKSRRDAKKGLVKYIYVSAPWRMKNSHHTVLYDEHNKLVDVFPSNGRGLYSGKQLSELRAESAKEVQP
jgi:hypothetical protein